MFEHSFRSQLWFNPLTKQFKNDYSRASRLTERSV